MKGVIVDDEKINLMIIQKMANQVGLDVECFENPLEALDYINNNEIDLVMVDYQMPEMNGVDFIKNLRKISLEIPIVMITIISDNEQLKLEALEAGATEFLNKPLAEAEFKARITNLMTLREAQVLLKDRAALLEREVKTATKEIVDREFETLQVLGNAAEFKDPETSDHIKRVASYCRMLAKLLGEDEKMQELMFYASPLHDVGKIGIPDSILLKEGKLAPDEWEMMKTHTDKGCRILLNTKSQYMQAGATIALTHHEKYNGTGYPKGLKGDEIPLIGRITAVADVFDALTTRRPYKKPWSLEKAFMLLEDEKGKHFDPRIVDLFLKNLGEVKDVIMKFGI